MIDLGLCLVTHYCNCRICTGKTPEHPGYGVCADGTRTRPGVVAADPSVIPLGSFVRLIPFNGPYVGRLFIGQVHDTGGKIKQRRLDIWLATHSLALAAGVFPAHVSYNRYVPTWGVPRGYDAPSPVRRRGGYPTIRQGRRGGWPVDEARRLLIEKEFGHLLRTTDLQVPFDDAMTLAVKAFQQSRRLAVDGIIGPRTWAALLD